VSKIRKEERSESEFSRSNLAGTEDRVDRGLSSHEFKREKTPADIPKIIDSPFGIPRPLESTSMSVQSLLVGRLGLDPSTLRVFPERPGTSIIVQIYWPDEVQCPPTSTEVHSRLTSWLDSWLDQGSFQVHVTVQFRGAYGEVLELKLGEE